MSKPLTMDDLDLSSGDKVALSLSGGLDSVTLMHYLAEKVGPKNVFPISFNYNQRHDYELLCAGTQVLSADIPKDNFRIVDVSFLGDIAQGMSAMVRSDVKVPTVQQALGDPQPASYMPFRNLIFSSLVACYAEANGVKNIALGIQRVDQLGYWDTTSEFVDRLQAVFNLNRKNTIKVITPFVESSKVDEIELGLKLGIEYQYSWTCYNGPHTKEGVTWDNDPELRTSHQTRFLNVGNAYACGVCASCADRKAAFKKLNAEDQDVLYLEPQIATELYNS